MKIKIKLLNEKAKLPSKTYKSDFCYDCVATSCEIVSPGVYKYGLGFAIEIDNENFRYIKYAVCKGIELRARSSIYKTGMLLTNTPGTIDEDYRGEIFAVFYHVKQELPPYQIGDKICQLRFICSEQIEWVEVDSLTETQRGEDGYGSTGK